MKAGAFLFAAVMLFGVQQSLAATITLDTLTSTSGSEVPTIVVDGELNRYDAIRFEDIAKQIQGRALVELNSPGGSLDAGIEIGRIIRRYEFSTVVHDVCASACALAWLAGRLKIASTSARIGFHVAYVDGEFQETSGTGNALVGLYIGELGLGANVVRYVTGAAPAEMQWLNFRDAELLGIDVTPLEASAPEPEPAATLPEIPINLELEGFQLANAARAVSNGLNRYGDAGISGLAASSAACWPIAREKRSYASVQYCRVLDLLAVALDKNAADNYGLPRYPYFTDEGRLNDVILGLEAVGVTDADQALMLDNLWRRQLLFALETQ